MIDIVVDISSSKLFVGKKKKKKEKQQTEIKLPRLLLMEKKIFYKTRNEEFASLS